MKNKLSTIWEGLKGSRLDKCRFKEETEIFDDTFFQARHFPGVKDTPYSEMLIFCPLNDIGEEDKKLDKHFIVFMHSVYGNKGLEAIQYSDYRYRLLRRCMDLDDFPVYAQKDYDKRQGTASFLGPFTNVQIEKILSDFSDDRKLMPHKMIDLKISNLDTMNELNEITKQNKNIGPK
jgi:hypothetical protein